jgi:hypothetical protein
MKKLKQIFTIAALMVLSASVSAQVEENFEDGDFLKNPTWMGDTGQFRINSSRQLQLKSENSDTSYLSTECTRIEKTEWRFWVKISFNTSANNFARVYLASDQQDLKKPLNGYFLQIGGSNDSITFFKQAGTQTDKLFQATHINTAHTTNVLQIRVIHDSTGIWHLFADTLGGTNLIDQGNCQQNDFQTSSWFGVYCKYTSSNSTKFYFDDFFIGPVQVDTTPPSLNTSTIINSKEIELFFSENVNRQNAEIPSHYSTLSAGSPSEVAVDVADSRKVKLIFQHEFSNGFLDTLTIFEIIDLQGNKSPLIRVPFCMYQEKSFDVVISEIMADPEPSAGLPSSEYVELFNRTKEPINLKDWVFQYGTRTKKFPDITLAPFGFLLLTYGDSLQGFGSCVSIFTSASSLANETSTLVLKNKEGKIIHSVCYSKEWYQTSYKEDGGWSLEMIDPDNPCGCLENWGASTSGTGGTPGRSNSIQRSNPDFLAPYLKRARIIPDNQIEIFFSEAMDSLSLVGIKNWTTDHGLGHPGSLTFISPEFNHIRLWYPNSFQKGILYSISSNDKLMDCAMNKIDTLITVRAAIPDTIRPGDIIINEILSNPKTGGERFVEIYNRSQNILDLKGLVIASLDLNTNKLEKTTDIVTSDFLCFPGDYYILSGNSRDIQSRYFSPGPDVFIDLESMPSYQEDNDVVVIARKSDETIVDEVKYSEDMHFPLLNYTEGVSLERINPFLSSGEKSNWHSASENCGFATPGYKNSQYRNSSSEGNWVTIISPVFSPDNDGKDDFVSLILRPDRPDCYVSITVFNNRGQKVRQLLNNRLLSSLEQVIWDGIDDNRQKVAIGIYILYFEFINPDGNKKQVKKAVVVAGII